jgi:opacity protein-like surface antigen
MTTARRLAIAAAIAPLTPACLAQLEQPEREVTVDLDLGGVVSFKSDIDQTDGDVSIYRLAYGVGVGIPIAKAGQLKLAYDGEYSHYDFENVERIMPGVSNPFSDIYKNQLIASYSHRFDEEWSAFGGGYVQSYGEHSADFNDTLTAGLFLAGTYTVNANLTLGLGVSAEGRLEGDIRAMPRFFFDWRFHDQWRLYNRPTISGTSITLAYEINEQWTLSLDGSWIDRQFRLDDDLSIPNAVVSDERASVGFGVEWKPTPNLSVTGRAGAHLWQEYEVRDSNNNRMTRSRTDPGPALSLELVYRF